MSFGNDIDRFTSKAQRQIDATVKEIVSEVALSLILKSPVGDPALWESGRAPKGYVGGQFRANWQYGLGEINLVTTNLTDADGGATLDKIVGSIPDEAGGKIHFLTNSLPYAIRLENGWSKQAPYGMVTLTAIEFLAITQASLRTINGKEFGA